MARVNLEQHRLIRSSEQVVFPMIGDGMSQPDEVALMGNFHITPVSKNESWVTVGEWLPEKMLGAICFSPGSVGRRSDPSPLQSHHGPANLPPVQPICLSSWSHAHSLVRHPGRSRLSGRLLDSQSASRVGWPATSGGGRHWSLADCRRAHRGRLLYVITFWEAEFSGQPWTRACSTSARGLVFYGGFIGAVLMGMIYLRKQPLAIAENGRCPGAQHRPGSCLWPSGLPHDRLLFGSMDLPWAITFSSRSCDPSASGSPTQIYESAFNFILFASLAWFYRRKRFDGQVLPFTCWPMPFCGRSMSISGLRCRSSGDSLPPGKRPAS